MHIYILYALNMSDFHFILNMSPDFNVLRKIEYKTYSGDPDGQTERGKQTHICRNSLRTHKSRK